MDSIVTRPLLPRDPSESDVRAAADSLAHLQAEARTLGNNAAAASIHHAMGRIFGDQLGDARSAAICFQNAFRLNPRYRPNLEAARRLFAQHGAEEKALALHRHEEALLRDPAERAESLRAQAVLLERLGRAGEAKKTVEEALRLAPDHPALLLASADAAVREGDRPAAIRLLLRSADATVDPIHKARLLRRAILLAGQGDAQPDETVAALRAEATAKLHQADPNDPIGFSAMLLRARAANDWEAVLRLCRQRAERTGAAADRALVAAIAAYRLGRVSEGLAEVTAALENHRRDGALLALQSDLAAQQKSPALADILRQRAEGCVEPSERAHLKIRAALLLDDPLDKEQLLTEALGDDPGDAAAIAVHARLVTQRDPRSAADRFVALGEALEAHSPQEAASHYLEAGAWHERAGGRTEAAALANRALELVPRHPAALRLLIRTLPAIGGSVELADVLERASAELPRALGAELLARAAALVAESNPGRSIHLARRAAEMARGLVSPRWLESWCTFAFKAGEFAELSQALEARADSTSGSDAADLLLEASELARACGDDIRSTTLLRKARGVDPASAAARAALLALPILAPAERAELLQEEARQTFLERAAALHAERALVLEEEGRVDEAVQACAQALALTGLDLAVLRRLANLQLQRGDAGAALAVLVQIAEMVPEGHARAEAYGRAAEVAEWRVGDPLRAAELYRAAAGQHPRSAFAWAHLARLLSWTGRAPEAAEACEHLAAAAEALSERNEARRQAASLYAHRGSQPAKAATLLRALLADAPHDLECAAELLERIEGDEGPDALRERADLRARLAARCQDPRVASLLRAESAEDRLQAGERDQAIAEYRRALALNPRDRVALDRVEQALRGGGEKSILAEHLAFRCSFADGETRAALALEQAEIFAAEGRIDEAGEAYRQALASDPDSLIALKGARHVAELRGEKEEVARLLAREASLSHDSGAMVESALLAEDMGHGAEAVERLTSVLEADPGNAEVAAKLRRVLGEGAARALASTFERIGQEHADARLSARAWTEAAEIELRELDDGAAAFLAAGRALAKEPLSLRPLELRADAAEAAGRARDAAEAVQKLIDAGGDEGGDRKLRLGRLHAQAGDAEKALPLLGPALATLPSGLLLNLAAGAPSLPPAEGARLYRQLLDVFETAEGPRPPATRLAAWSESLGRILLSQGDRAAALEAFRRALRHEPANAAALRQIAELGTPAEGIEAQLAVFDASPGAEPLRALCRLYQVARRPEGAYSAAAALVGLELARPEERALYEPAASRPPPVDLPRIADGAAVHAQGDEGPARELFSAAMPELAKALATENGNRGALVKGDNPVRRVVAAIARALGMPEPQIYLARAEPAIVAPLAAETPGILVGAEVPKRWSPRQQRFLYARALAHIRRGTHPLAQLPAAQLAAVAGELARIAGVEGEGLPPPDPAIAERLSRHFGPQARARIAPFAARVAAERPADWEGLALGIRESAERVALGVCGDPAAALSIVSREVDGGLSRPEIARLARFAVSEAWLTLRGR